MGWGAQVPHPQVGRMAFLDSTAGCPGRSSASSTRQVSSKSWPAPREAEAAPAVGWRVAFARWHSDPSVSFFRREDIRATEKDKVSEALLAVLLLQPPPPLLFAGEGHLSHC